MPSPLARRLLHSRLFATLASARVGVVLALLVTVQLMASSLFIPSPRSRDRLPFSEDMTFFLQAPWERYPWFWLLALSTALLALSTALGALRAFWLRAAAGRLDARAWGVALVHLGFLVGLAAHLQAGLSAGVEGQVLLGPDPTPVGAHSLRVVEGSLRHTPDGSLLAIDAVVEDERGRRQRLGFNRPWFYDGYRRWVLVQGAQPSGAVPVFEVEGTPVRAAAGQGLQVGGATWTVQRVSTNPSLRTPMVALLDPQGQPLWVGPGWSQGELRLVGFDPALVITALLRRNDGIPLLLVAMGVFTLGVALFVAGRRPAG
ncbi:hypothetical protein L6R53_17985 [Myxococcota bacterium]|nr:hypothetical protein [Myxococcota bacterium]